MTLTDIRAAEHDDLTLTSDQQLAAYLTGLSTETVDRDLTAHMSDVELRMLANHQRNT